MVGHLGHDKHEPVINPSGNTNGKSKKTLKGEFGELSVKILRDRHGSFEPQLIPKHQTRWTGLDDRIIPLYDEIILSGVDEYQQKWTMPLRD